MSTPTETPDVISSQALPSTHPGQPHTVTSTIPSGDSASVAGQSVVSFVSGLSQQNREDVLNSTLYMQLRANKKFDKAAQREQWFKCYTDGLGTLGWTLSGSAIEAYEPSQQSFTLDEVSLEIIEAVAGGTAFSPTVKKTFEALKHQPKALEIFESHNAKSNMGMFQILPCVQSADGSVAMLLNCMQFSTNHLNYKVLFFTYKRNAVQIYRSAQVAVLDNTVYDRVRKTVLDELGKNARDFVAHLAI